MQRYDLDSTRSYEATTLEYDLVNRVRRCWNNRRDEYQRNNLKDAIAELRTFRNNRSINPELHATLDKEAIACFHGSGTLLPTPQSEAQWDRYCQIKNLLSRGRIDEPRQESLIEGMPVTTEKPKGRVRTRPPVEKITQDYFTKTLQLNELHESSRQGTFF